MSFDNLMCAVCENPDIVDNYFTLYKGHYICEVCLEDWLNYIANVRLKGHTEQVFARWVLELREKLRKEREEKNA